MARKFGLGLVVLFVLLQIGAIFFHVGSGKVGRVFAYFVLPPAWIRFSPVSYHRVVETTHAFVALGVAPSYGEAFPQALGFVIRDTRLRQLLPGVQMDDLSSVDTFAFLDAATLATYGISSREIMRYIREPLTRLRVASVLRDTRLPSQEMRIAGIEEKLSLGMPFYDVARIFSEDQSAMYDGDLGTFSLDNLPSWAWGVTELEVGEYRGGFVGDDAFWILRLEERGGTGDSAWVRLRGIAVNKPTIGDILRAHGSQYPANVFVW